jgi:hypothetical protein
MSLAATIGLKDHLLCSPPIFLTVHIWTLKWRQYAPRSIGISLQDYMKSKPRNHDLFSKC